MKHGDADADRSHRKSNKHQWSKKTRTISNLWKHNKQVSSEVKRHEESIRHQAKVKGKTTKAVRTGDDDDAGIMGIFIQQQNTTSLQIHPPHPETNNEVKVSDPRTPPTTPQRNKGKEQALNTNIEKQQSKQ